MKNLLLIGVCLMTLFSFVSAGDEDGGAAIKFVGGGADGTFYSSGSGDDPAPITNKPEEGGAPIKYPVGG